MIEFALCGFVKNTLHLKKVDVGVYLSKPSVVDLKSPDFPAYLLKPRPTVADVKSVNVAKEESCIGGETSLDGIARRK
jgi:hypothetical protein